ncbi:MAG TPA: SDR family oxidoreductase [Chloroflexota bacterium]|nr:SDR family oxidoreductase [Chloroflexota bacterium]
MKYRPAALRERRAVVTGASSGLGADFARELAAYGCQPVLVARRAERLKALHQELADRFGVDAEVVIMDLGTPDSPRELYEQLSGDSRPVDVLINNAGYGAFGRFLDIPWEQERQMLELDMLSLTHLTKLFARDTVARRFGLILQASSIGAFQPTPTYASYSAAKAYVLSLGEALHYELRGTGVTCTVLVPTIVATDFRAVAGQQTTLYQRLMMMDSPTVVRAGLRGLLDGRASVIPGRLNALTALSTRLLPRQVAAAIAERLMLVR